MNENSTNINKPAGRPAARATRDALADLREGLGPELAAAVDQEIWDRSAEVRMRDADIDMGLRLIRKHRSEKS